MVNIFILAKGLSMGAGVPVVPSFLVYRSRINQDSTHRARINTDSLLTGRMNTDVIHKARVRARN